MTAHSRGTRPAQKITWKGSNGLLMHGVVLQVRSRGVLAGWQNPNNPTVKQTKFDGRFIRVPNNSVWAVPFESIVQTGEWLEPVASGD